MMYEAYRVDRGEKLKTKTLGCVKVSPLLLRLVDDHIQKNKIKNRSTFIRGLLYKALNINIGDFITCETPFLKTVKPEKRKWKGKRPKPERIRMGN